MNTLSVQISYLSSYNISFKNGIVSVVEFIPSTNWIGFQISTLASFDEAQDVRMHASAVNQE